MFPVSLQVTFLYNFPFTKISVEVTPLDVDEETETEDELELTVAVELPEVIISDEFCTQLGTVYCPHGVLTVHCAFKEVKDTPANTTAAIAIFEILFICVILVKMIHNIYTTVYLRITLFV